MSIQTKKPVSVMMDRRLYHQIVIISMIRKMFFGEKNASMSSIVNTAIEEYLQNHKDEIKELYDRYHAEGGCANI